MKFEVPYEKKLRKLVSSGPTPLFATVSGAHLYGFPSADSDVDLRGSFVIPLKDSLGLNPPDETLTVSDTIDGIELDWVAHDVRKFVGLMPKNNGYVLEQVLSPLVVHGGDSLDHLRELAHGCIVRNLFLHYRGFLNNQVELLGKRPSTKALLYICRVALTGIHVLKTGEIQSNLPTLMKLQPGSIIEFMEWTNELIERKRSGAEKGELGQGDTARATTLVDQLRAELEQAHNTSRLPSEVSNLPELNNFVIRTRLELGQ